MAIGQFRQLKKKILKLFVIQRLNTVQFMVVSEAFPLVLEKGKETAFFQTFLVATQQLQGISFLKMSSFLTQSLCCGRIISPFLLLHVHRYSTWDSKIHQNNSSM
uniref:Uncharacterized protein n=1 Tax=Sphaerodactylus townsendi TaxID=933632 RepID=A0ACB8FQG5_9SAUR